MADQFSYEPDPQVRELLQMYQSGQLTAQQQRDVANQLNQVSGITGAGVLTPGRQERMTLLGKTSLEPPREEAQLTARSYVADPVNAPGGWVDQANFVGIPPLLTGGGPGGELGGGFPTANPLVAPYGVTMDAFGNATPTPPDPAQQAEINRFGTDFSALAKEYPGFSQLFPDKFNFWTDFFPTMVATVTGGAPALMAGQVGGGIGYQLGGEQGRAIGAETAGGLMTLSSMNPYVIGGTAAGAAIGQAAGGDQGRQLGSAAGGLAGGAAGSFAGGASAPSAAGGGGSSTVPPFGADTSGASPSGAAQETGPGAAAIGTGAVPQTGAGEGFNPVIGVSPTSPAVTGAAPIDLSGTSLAQPSISDILQQNAPTAGAPGAGQSFSDANVLSDINSALKLAETGGQISAMLNPPTPTPPGTISPVAPPASTVGPTAPAATFSLDTMLPSIDSWAQSQLLGIRSRFARLGIANSPMEQQAMRQFATGAESRVGSIRDAMATAGATDPQVFMALLTSNLQTPEQFSNALATRSLAAA